LTRHGKLLTADWILPVSAPPIENGGLLMRGATVTDLGPLDAVRSRHPDAPVSRLPPGAVMPGLVNAHTHLELASLGRLPATGGFASWAGRVIAAKENLSHGTIREGIRRAATAMRNAGTAYAADISNFRISAEVLEEERFPATVFHEFIGIDPVLFDEWEAHDARIPGEDRDRTGVSLLAACHTPFSAGPDLIQRCARWASERNVPWSIHLAESADETEFLLNGGGPLRELLLNRGIEGVSIPTPGMRSVPYLESLGCLDERLIAVHLVQIDERDAALLARRGVRPCLCPSSNLHLAGRLPPVALMLAAGLRPALGTDSPVSGDGLDLFREMEILLDAGVDGAIIIDMATRFGAEALHLPGDFGRIEKGKQPALIHLAFASEKKSDVEALAIRAGARGRMSPVEDFPGG
jgi:cytosine/adenosine deaminase-related metal-dependent hydrolase